MNEPPASAADTRNAAISWLLDAAILVAGTAGTYFAIGLDRPRTAALVYLLTVLVVGARSGLYRGLLAALIVSFIYNFFLSEPVFRLGASSLDEFVPLLAFNATAIVSGGLAGRLNDRAKAAQAAEAKNALLLELSDQLQRAITIADVENLARASLQPRGVRALHIEPVEAPGRPLSSAPADGDDDTTPAADDDAVFGLEGSGGQVGVVRFVLDGRARDPRAGPDLQAVSNLLALAIDRCLLLEQLSESRAAQRSEELKSALLSSVSHDLRTPLTAIEAAASSLRAFRHELAPDQEEEMLATIADQCAKLNRYTANLLDMGRIQAGISESQFAQVDLVEILGVALGSIRKHFPELEIDKTVSVPTAVVSANEVMLEQVIFNLLENAALHGGKDKPVLVRLTLDKTDCFLEITDHGPGISPTEQHRVFERFYRGRQAVQREGSGLGLYIARGFVEAFRGAIDVQSPVVGMIGTTVTVRLPLLPTRAGPRGFHDAHPDR